MIRPATTHDLDAIAAQVMERFAGHLSPPSLPHVKKAVGDTISAGLAIVADDRSPAPHAKTDDAGSGGSRLLGSIGLTICQWHHSGAFYLTDVWTCGRFRDLLTGARATASSLGLPLYLGVTRERPEAAMRLYRAGGGQLVGALFRFNPAN